MNHNLAVATSSRLLCILGFALVRLVPASAHAQGPIVSWGGDHSGQVTNTPGGSAFTQVAGGSDFALALSADGSIVSWGDDLAGQVSNTPPGVGFTQVAAGWSHCLALRADSSIVAWGHDSGGQVSNTPTLPGFTQVAGGGIHSLALRTDGSIVSWGSDLNGLISNTPTGTGFIQVAGGTRHSLALRAGGSIASWGYDIYGQVSSTPSGTGFVQVSGGRDHSLALHSDGSIVSWGYDGYGAVSNTPGGTGFIQVAGGSYHSLAVRADGTMESWGRDAYGEVSNTPTFPDFTQVAGGGTFSLALVGGSAGAYCFGDGTGALCPCFGVAAANHGCPNSGSSNGASLLGSGHASILSDTFALSVTEAALSKPGLVLSGTTDLSPGINTLPDSAGLLCVGGAIQRGAVVLTDATGAASLPGFQGAAYGQAANVSAGSLSTYQFWFRDPSTACPPYDTASGDFNFSNGWRMTWLP